jgi:predicted metalloprotease
MRWQGQRQSTNIEDRRGMRVTRRGVMGGGLGLLAVMLIGMFLGVDPRLILGGAQVVNAVAPPQPKVEDTGPYQESAEEAQERQFMAVVLADTEDVWGEIFAQGGASYRQPKLVLFNGAVESACGIAESAMGPFYCPPDERVFLDTSFFDEMSRRMGAPGDFAQAYVVAHEIGHHVQNLLGTSSQVHQLQQRYGGSRANQLSVMLELQADCYAGVWAHHAERMRGILEAGDVEEALGAAAAVGDDRLQRQARGFVVPDSFTHGTSEQRVRWFRAGLQSGSMEACDTFSADNL